MAFEVFGQVSKKRRLEREEKYRKQVMIGIIITLLVILCIGGGIFAYVHCNSGRSRSTKKGSSFHKETLTTLCAPTDYKDKCEDALKTVIKTSSDPVKPKEIVKAPISAASAELRKAYKIVSSFKFENPEEKAAFESCKNLFEDAKEELQESISKVVRSNINDSYDPNSISIDDLKTWLSAVASYQEACVDGFPDGKLKTKIRKTLNVTKEHVSNSLALITQLKTVLPVLPSHHIDEVNKKATNDDNHHLGQINNLTNWLGHQERKLLTKSTANLLPNITVAQDGSGNYKTIKEALESVSKKRPKGGGRFFIYVKQGIYQEYVTVTKTMVNITMYGDGSQKTIITGNKSVKSNNIPTYQTATFAALGEGFVAIAIGFRNTAGAENHQAVALRVQSDKAIFLDCRMEGFQDTLYVQCHRQFYKNCFIIGTVDFIFGDATAVFQNCMILARKPLDGQKNIVTAQGRTCRYENTGFVLHKCTIAANQDFQKDKFKFKTYLGRPANDYSRTIVMESTLGKIIEPQGWIEAGDEDRQPNSTTRGKSLYYAEYKNTGPGSGTKGRVNWPGYRKTFTQKEASHFTVKSFLEGMVSWIKVAGIPNVQFDLGN